MIIKKYKPTSSGFRHRIKLNYLNIYKGKPFYNLLSKKNRSGGRNNLGRITVRHIGGGHKKKYRILDFKRNKYNILGKVERIEYDPNRSSLIALILYKDGERRYILCPENIKIGDFIESGDNVPIKLGNCLLIKNIPISTFIHNIELIPNKGGQISRSAGSYSQLIVFENKYAILKLRSGEIRKINILCRATIGKISNSKYMLRNLGKAGSSRWLGIRPTVRGTAMNPVDHPHGGGEGRNFGKHPVSPWGFKTKGKKTRKNKRTNKFIIKFRNKK